jgi:DNA-binding CsgD family transcriptional regulator
VKKNLLLYGAILALLTVLLQVAEYRLLVIDHTIELYVGLVAIVFIVLGVVMGRKLTTPKQVEVVVEKLIPVTTNPALPFAPNDMVLDKLGISKREHEILLLIAEGMSNQEIADNSFVSINTVKTHVSNILVKLDVKRRAQAIQKARELGIVP